MQTGFNEDTVLKVLIESKEGGKEVGLPGLLLLGCMPTKNTKIDPLIYQDVECSNTMWAPNSGRLLI